MPFQVLAQEKNYNTPDEMRSYYRRAFFSALDENDLAKAQSLIAEYVAHKPVDSLNRKEILYLSGELALSENDPAQAAVFFSKALPFNQGELNKKTFAVMTCNLALCYDMLTQYDTAILIYLDALKIYRELNDSIGVSVCNSNMGSIFMLMGSYNKALNCFLNSLEIDLKTPSRGDEAITLSNLGILYKDKGDYRKALDYLLVAEEIFLENNQEFELSRLNNNIGNIYMRLQMHDSAMFYYTKSLEINQKMNQPFAVSTNLDNMGLSFQKVKDYKTALTYHLRALEELNNIGIEKAGFKLQNNLGKCYDALGNTQKARESFIKAKGVAEEQHLGSDLAEVYANLATNYRSTSEYKVALEYSDLAAIWKDSTNNLVKSRDFGRMEAEFEYDRKIEEITFQKKIVDLENENELRKQKNFRNISLFGLLGAIALGLVLFNRNRVISLANATIKKEQERSEELLLNILPKHTAEELKRDGKTTPKTYENVTVMFSDFKGFTTLSELLAPDELVYEIDHCYSNFDDIVDENGLEKIKSVGDAYICVGGLNTQASEASISATAIVKAAIEIQRFMENLKEQRIKEGRPYFEARIGLHSGPVVAGVVGKRKFAYDIWGDTVNTAARMETSSEAGRVNVSQKTKELVIGGFEFEYRGKIQAKNKGELDMYFVDEILEIS